MKKKMEKKLGDLSFALDAIKDAGLAGKTSVTANGYVDVESGRVTPYGYEVWGRGRDAGTARIYYEVDGDYSRVSVAVADYGERNKFHCFTYEEVVEALKKLIPRERIDPDPYAAPF